MSIGQRKKTLRRLQEWSEQQKESLVVLEAKAIKLFTKVVVSQATWDLSSAIKIGLWRNGNGRKEIENTKWQGFKGVAELVKGISFLSLFLSLVPPSLSLSFPLYLDQDMFICLGWRPVQDREVSEFQNYDKCWEWAGFGDRLRMMMAGGTGAVGNGEEISLSCFSTVPKLSTRMEIPCVSSVQHGTLRLHMAPG